MNSWTVVCRPVEHGDVRGLGVFITDGLQDREVGRVAFVRSLAKKANQEIEFGEKLDEIVKKADTAADLVNDTMYEVERMNQLADTERIERETKAVSELATKLKDAVGSSPRPNAKFD